MHTTYNYYVVIYLNLPSRRGCRAVSEEQQNQSTCERSFAGAQESDSKRNLHGAKRNPGILPGFHFIPSGLPSLRDAACGLGRV